MPRPEPVCCAPMNVARTRLALLAIASLAPLAGVAGAQPACDAATQYAYTFRNQCAEAIWIGQRSKADPTAHPPQSGN